MIIPVDILPLTNLPYHSEVAVRRMVAEGANLLSRFHRQLDPTFRTDLDAENMPSDLVPTNDDGRALMEIVLRRAPQATLEMKQQAIKEISLIAQHGPEGYIRYKRRQRYGAL